MRGTYLALLLLAAVCGFAPPASAQGQTPLIRQQPTLPAGLAPFLGGVPSGTPTSDTITLSIYQAITRALANNLGALTAEAAIGRSNGTRWITLSQMLPNVNGRVAESRQKVNLAAFGFPLPSGVPAVVGPFNVFDARVYVSQSVLDFRARNELQEDSHNLAAAQYSYKSARDLVVLVAAATYLQALAASARVDSVQAQLQTSQAIYDQAVNLKAGGLVAGIDVIRAEVQVSTRKQRATTVTNDFEKAKLQLARVVGLPVGQAFTLTEQLPAVPAPDITLEQALDRAYRTRPDYQAALERVQAAEAARRAAFDEQLPSVRVNADYGEIGLTVGSAVGTYSIVGAVNVPIFQGGRSHGRLLEADADLRDKRAEAEDLRASIDYDVRTAFLDLKSGEEQMDVATRSRDLAAQQLTQARDRFAAGVASNIEIVQAQEDVAVASEQYISAVYTFNIGKALLARGIGIAEQAASQFLGGNP